MILDTHEPEIKPAEHHDRYPEGRRSGEPNTVALWAAFGLLMLALIGVGAYGYRTLEKDHIQLSQVPDMLNSMFALRGRMDSAEAKILALSGDWSGLAERVGKLERRTSANLQLARKHAEDLTTQLEERVQGQMRVRDSLVDHRLNGLEAHQVSDREQLARLQEELGTTRQEIAAVRQDARAGLANLDAQTARNEQQVAEVARKLDYERVNFELAKARTYELARGISVHITRTDPSYQRYGAWVSLTPDGRTLWVERHGIEQPVVFYRQQDGERCELVVTRVARDSVVGYLLLPVA